MEPLDQIEAEEKGSDQTSIENGYGQHLKKREDHRTGFIVQKRAERRRFVETFC